MLHCIGSVKLESVAIPTTDTESQDWGSRKRGPCDLHIGDSEVYAHGTCILDSTYLST